MIVDGTLRRGTRTTNYCYKCYTSGEFLTLYKLRKTKLTHQYSP
ncbi:MAG TPA: hypothetical protein DIC58_06975 [Gammaproteobacteria bacterium]|nr:hypothetical protein [Gammaproteobacteria bacterium]